MMMFSTEHKIFEIDRWDSLRERLEAARAQGKRIVFTNGCFDLLHVGHVTLLEAARAEGDLMVVGLNTDASVKRAKGPDRPKLNEQERARVMAALRCVDIVTLFDEDTPKRIIEDVVQPDVLVKGSDWGHGRIVGEDFVKARGGKVVSFPLLEGHSTTSIIERASEARSG
jgi:D-beta-D-heptose 7-phosphate kinase/D-beta-D-heptose 1-phosphate adenosyltransferase